MDSDHSSIDETRPVSEISKQRACDECRTRKIRCDRKPPCGHCRAAGLVCRVSSQRPRERKSRVIISKEYEHKIDGIERRLASIENLLRSNLSAASSSTNTVSVSGTPASHPRQQNPPVEVEQEEEAPAPFFGFTGPNADSILAKEVVEHTVEGDLIALNEKLRTALQSLEQIVGRMKADTSEPSLKSLAALGSRSPEDLVVPPWDEISTLLNRAKENHSATFILSLPSMPPEEFAQKCYELYNHPQHATPIRRLLVYTGLYGLTSEYSAFDSGQSAQYHADLAAKFHNLVLSTLGNLPMIVPPSMESVESIMTAACFAVDICKPSLCQTLVTVAARLSQILGYHRFSTMSNDSQTDRDRKIMLFWYVYTLDKMVSLRLGHASAIRDFEVALPKPQASEAFPEAFVHLISFWIDAGRVQGQICEQLYSPAALTQSSSVRATRARQLAKELQEAYNIRAKANVGIVDLFPIESDVSGFIAHRLINGGDEIMHYSTLTLILHAIPVTQPGGVSLAVEAARAALRASPDLSEYENNNKYFWTLYCHWITLNTPLTPFTVLFCHIIANHEDCAEDMKLLETFVRSLHRSSSVSEGAERIYQLCSIFWKVAEAYIEVKNHEARRLREADNAMNNGVQNATALQPVIGDFDEYLNALGLAPQPFQAAPSELPETAFPMEEDLSAYLQDWYTGNVSLFGLLEQDLGDIGGLGFEHVGGGQ